MNALLFTTVDESTGKIKVPQLQIGFILAAIVISALSLLTALQWSQAFQLSIQNLQNKHKDDGLNEEEASYVVAAAVTVLIIIVTIIVYVVIRSSNKRHLRKAQQLATTLNIKRGN